MKSFGLRIACACLALVLLPLSVRSETVSYAPPAGNLPTGRLHGQPYDAILPSGRLVTPAGTSVVTGMNTLGVVLSPDGRYAITSNDDEREGAARSALDPDASGGYSLTVVDTASMTAVMHYRAPNETFYSGLAAVKDPRDSTQTLVFAAGGASNAVYVFDLERSGPARSGRASYDRGPRTARSLLSPTAASVFRRRSSRAPTAGACTSSTPAVSRWLRSIPRRDVCSRLRSASVFHPAAPPSPVESCSSPTKV